LAEENKHMKYMMLIYANQSETPEFTPEERKAAAQAWFAFNAEAEAAGVLLYNDGLAPVTQATTVRVRNGETLISDGPFAETHEHLGGYYMLECKDLDEAISWAAKIPGARFGSIEIRPVNIYTQARDERSGQ
jgi:hypothetical protein